VNIKEGSQGCYEEKHMVEDFKLMESECSSWGVARWGEFMAQDRFFDRPEFRSEDCHKRVEQMTHKFNPVIYDELEEISMVGHHFVEDCFVREEQWSTTINKESWSTMDASKGGCNGKCSCESSHGCSRWAQMGPQIQNLKESTCTMWSQESVQKIPEVVCFSTGDMQDSQPVWGGKYTGGQRAIVAIKNSKRAPSSARSSSAWLGLASMAFLLCVG